MNPSNHCSLPFEERNQQDFLLVTARIQAALEKMANDKRIKRTEKKLAELAGCARGTLRNREWPLEQLNKLKDEARAAKETQEVVPRSNREKSNIERYQDLLSKNRDELLIWKYKHDTLRDMVQTLEGQRDAQKQRAENLEAQLRALIASTQPRSSNVTLLPIASTNVNEVKKQDQ